MLNNISKALIKIDLKDADIVYVSFSPNGSNIALALSNGSIFFYEVCYLFIIIYFKHTARLKCN